jgi:hypothetical protein
MLEVLSVLTTTTVAIKQGEASEFILGRIIFLTHLGLEMNLNPFKQQATKNEVDKALQRLESLDISALRRSKGATAESSHPDGTPALVG